MIIGVIGWGMTILYCLEGRVQQEICSVTPYKYHLLLQILLETTTVIDLHPHLAGQMSQMLMGIHQNQNGGIILMQTQVVEPLTVLTTALLLMIIQQDQIRIIVP